MTGQKNKIRKLSNSYSIKNSLKFLSWNIQAPSTTGEGDKFKVKGEVILCGDFNSSIGQQPGMMKNDSNKFFTTA